MSEWDKAMHKAPQVLDACGVDFGYEGEMTVNVALKAQAQENYPFQRLTGPANVLKVPSRLPGTISVKLVEDMAGATVIGPHLSGIGQPVHICSTVSTVNNILNMAVIAACKVN